MEQIKKKRQTAENQQKKKKQKNSSIAGLCRCTPTLKTVSNSGAKVELHTCSHVLRDYGFLSGDRIRHQDKGDGFVMGVGSVNIDYSNRERLFVKFDSDKGCKFLDGFTKEKMELLYRPRYSDSKTKFHALIADMMEKVRLQESLSDVMLIFGDRKIQCHKNILCAASEYFKVMLTSEHFMESKQREIRMFEDDPVLFEILISFIYGKYTVLDGDNAMGVYELARKYNVSIVTALVEEKIYDLLTEENVFGAIKTFLNDSNLECFKQCYRYIINNYERFKEKKQYLDLRTIKHNFMDEFWQEVVKKTTVIYSEK